MKTAARNLNNIIRTSRESNTVCNSSQETIIGESCHKYHFCRDVFVATKHVFCRDKSVLVAKKLCLLRQHIFVASGPLSRQNICRNKHNFVATSMFLSRQKTCFVVTNACLSQQTRVCRDTHMFLSRQNYVCRSKNVTCGSFRQ